MKVDDRVTMRSAGRQVRSRERVETLLGVAELMIEEAGIEGLKMRELARRASLPIASVYHYFPSSSSVVRALAIRHLDELGAFLAGRLQVHVRPEIPTERRADLAGEIVREVAVFLLRSSATAAIWDSLRANPDLRALDIADTKQTAQLLEPFIGWAAPDIPEERLSATSILLVEAIQSSLLLIMHTVGESREVLTATLADIMVAAFRGFQAGGRSSRDAKL